MKVQFTETDPANVLEAIKAAMAGRKLGDIVDFTLEGQQLLVTISKMGTSTLTFHQETNAGKSSAAGGLTYNLAKEKIAFTHKAFKSEVERKIVQVIEQAGGSVQA